MILEDPAEGILDSLSITELPTWIVVTPGDRAHVQRGRDRYADMEPATGRDANVPISSAEGFSLHPGTDDADSDLAVTEPMAIEGADVEGGSVGLRGRWALSRRRIGAAAKHEINELVRTTLHDRERTR